MMRLVQQIDTTGPICQLSRLNYTIFGSDDIQNMLEVDTRHQMLLKRKLTYPPLSVRCFTRQSRPTYLIITLNRIQTDDGQLISESNSKAQFTGAIDCRTDQLAMAKYHHNYKKHSIACLKEGIRHILKLSDQKIKDLFFNPLNNQIVYSAGSAVSAFDLADPQKQTILFRKSSVLHDSHNIYFCSLNLENKAKEQYECGIFDFRTGKHSDSWISKEPPIKVQSFARTLLVGANSSIEFFDMRKMIKPFDRESLKGLKDFLYEPNLSKLYIGCESKLKIYTIDS